MTSDAIVSLLAILTVVITLLLIRFRDGAVRRYFFNPIENGRILFGGLILVAGVITGLKSGVAYMVFLALIGIAFGTAFVYYEEPHKDIR